MHIDENPYSSPSATPQAGHHERSIEWQLSVAKALRLEPWAVACHVLCPVLNFVALQLAETKWEFAIGALMGAGWGLALVYSGWFAGHLYGWLLGVLLAFLSAFPMVGLLALWLFDRRARRELQVCGWRVRWFTAQLPEDSR
ncbi:hypothetical protein NG895_09635 [Aeoliella sp. ICT_H6.2]|uniref:Uncharacterized protein n=1 Tax=Aeoliella straminimaris TaxID=2954799 RepID=A0A9X2F9L6_9BACT|nr:hypothetical protein [Aeoliella straminimaris]MCO6044168.1 hypothetical protein [Aeoliella straminimaris]